MSGPVSFAVVYSLPEPATYIARTRLSRENFGIHMVRWPHDPAVSGDGSFTSTNPSRWQSELGTSVGWFRAFDPNMFGRYIGGAFVQDGTSAEGSPAPYGRMVGGTWYQGMLKPDGTYDFSKLELVLSSCATKGLKVLLSIGAQGAYWSGTQYLEYPLPTGEYWTVDPVGYQSRVLAFLRAMFAFAGNRISAIEMANEPGKWVRQNAVVGPGHTEQLVILCRLAKQVIREMGLSTLVLSTPFQGGETSEIGSFLNASAAGISVNGVDGSGTKGKDWIDVLAHHNYGTFGDRGGGGSTATMDAAGYNDPAADSAYPINIVATYMLAEARAVAASALAAGFTGPRWNTEFNVTGVVSTNLWTPRKMTQAGMERILYQCLWSSFAGGYDKCMLYACDHPALGFYDEGVGTVPVGEPADWFFKAPDNTSRGATALANVIGALCAGDIVIGTTNADPAFSVSATPFKVSNAASAGLFA